MEGKSDMYHVKWEKKSRVKFPLGGGGKAEIGKRKQLTQCFRGQIETESAACVRDGGGRERSHRERQSVVRHGRTGAALISQLPGDLAVPRVGSS